jgi:hypothetical protein
MQAGKRQMRLGLHAGRGRHGHAAVVQPRLADAGLAAKHERPTAGRDLVQERHQQGLLRGAPTNGTASLRVVSSIRAILPSGRWLTWPRAMGRAKAIGRYRHRGDG